MIKKIITIVVLTLGWTSIVLGQQEPATQTAKNTRSTALPNYVEGTSKEMQALDEEVRTWKNRSQSAEHFKKTEKRILHQIQKNPGDRAEGYLRLGQMHRLQYCPEVCSDSLAIYYYSEAEKLLTRPCDQIFLNAARVFLARSYMLPGRFQNLYLSQKYFINNIANNQRYGTEVGFIYLFGWGVEPDLYLAAQYFTLASNITGGAINALFLSYMDYMLQHKDELHAPHNFYAHLEDYAYTYCVENSVYRSIYPLSLAAEMGNAAAQCILGDMYCFDNAGSTDKSNRLEGFRLLRASVNNGLDESKFLLAYHCIRHYMDADKGDIYVKDENGNYKTEDLKKINSKAIGLIEQTAMKGNIQAILALGDIYANPDHDPTQPTDYLKAFYYLKAAEVMDAKNKSGDLMGTLRKEMAEHHVAISEEDSVFMTHNAENLALEVLYNKTSLFEFIDFVGDVRHPQGGDRSQIKISVPAEVMAQARETNPNVTEADYMKAEAYAMLYTLYTKKLERLSKSSRGFNDNFRRFLQQQLIQIRQHSEKLTYNMIEPTEWEKWLQK